MSWSDSLPQFPDLSRLQPASALTLARGSVRGRMVFLVLFLLLPGLAISAMLTWRTYVTERAGAATTLQATAHAVTQLVDREFLQAEVLLRTLAATQELQDGDVIGFDHLARATAVMGGSVVLISRGGQELIDTRVPLGTPMPAAAPPLDWDREKTGSVFITPLSLATPNEPASVRVVLPLALGGEHLYDLALIVPAQSFQSVLATQLLPPGWTASVMDANEVIVARFPEPGRFIGRMTGADLRRALSLSDEGVFNGTSISGIPVTFAFTRSPQTGWIAAIAAPQALIALSGTHSLNLLIWLGSALITAGLLGAVRVARGIAGPIEAVAHAARQLGATETMPPIRAGLAEADEVAAAMSLASRALIERRAALSEMNATLSARVAARTAELATANAALEAQRNQLDSVLGHMPVGVVVTNPRGEIMFINPEARRLIGDGEGPPGNVTLRPRGTDLPPRPAAELLAEHARAGRWADRDLWRLAKADGTKLDLEASTGPVLGPDGHLQLTVTTIQDVSRRLEAEEARRRSQRLEAVGQLTGGVSHEFNNLLMAISGCLDLLAPRIAEPRARALLANAQRATDRGARLTRQLLAFSRRQNLQVEPLDLGELVRGMTELLASTLGRAIEVVTDLAPDGWPAMADAAQLELMLLNLAINARDAMPGGGTLTIGTRNEETGVPKRPEHPPAGFYAVLTVTDTGHGMTKAVRARVFEPFFTTKEVGRGTGLGLPQVLGVAQQLGGGVKIRSSPGNGTSVSVYLPRANATPGPAASRPVPLPPAQTLKDVRILLADDDVEVREVARVILEEMGASVIEAGDGASAMLALRTGVAVDLVVADLTMPIVTGLELARQLLSLDPELPMVLMTGYSAAAMGQTESNIRATLQKPFRAEALGRAVAAALGRPTDPGIANE